MTLRIFLSIMTLSSLMLASVAVANPLLNLERAVTLIPAQSSEFMAEVDDDDLVLSADDDDSNDDDDDDDSNDDDDDSGDDDNSNDDSGDD